MEKWTASCPLFLSHYGYGGKALSIARAGGAFTSIAADGSSVGTTLSRATSCDCNSLNIVAGGPRPETPVSDQLGGGYFNIVQGTIGLVGSVGGLTNSIASNLGTRSSNAGYGGLFLAPDDEIAIFARQRGADTFRTFDEMGNLAQSLRINGSPENAFYSAFGRQPSPGEPYWITIAGKIGAAGRYPYLDAVGSPGHISIYGGDPGFREPGEFIKIWKSFTFGE